MDQVDTDDTMLVKCVCSNCGHSFLTDDQAGELTCPRCGFANDGAPVGGFEAPTALPPDFGAPEPQAFHRDPDPAFGLPSHFDPKSPPPMFMSSRRMARGMLVGGIFAAATGAAVGAAMAATGMVIPGVAALIMAFAAGAAVRQGMGGRTARRTKGFAVVAVLFAVLVGYAGIISGSWLVERFTGTRAAITRKDIAEGKKELAKNLARAQKVDDVNERTLLETWLRRAERLEAASDAELEDYLWVQQAQLNQPLVAYAKLRVMHAPLVKLGADREPIEAPEHMPMAIVGAELLLAFLLAYQGVKQKR
ncbi:MAG: TFIIB-type zinc ribbon-containing protein [Planctomycetota bacterium]